MKMACSNRLTAAITGLSSMISAQKPWRWTPSHPAIIYSGSNEGIEKTTTEGAAWDLKNQGITGWVPEHLGMNPHNPAVIYGVVNSVGIFGSTDGGTHWERLTVSTGGPIVVDPLNALHVVNADYDQFHIAFDGSNFDNHVPISLPAGMLAKDYQVVPNGDDRQAGLVGDGCCLSG